MIEEVVLDQVFDPGLHRPPDVVGIEDLGRAVVGMRAAEATNLIRLGVLFDNEAKRFINGILDNILRDEEQLTEKRQQRKMSSVQPERAQPKPAS